MKVEESPIRVTYFVRVWSLEEDDHWDEFPRDTLWDAIRHARLLRERGSAAGVFVRAVLPQGNAFTEQVDHQDILNEMNEIAASAGGSPW